MDIFLFGSFFSLSLTRPDFQGGPDWPASRRLDAFVYQYKPAPFIRGRQKEIKRNTFLYIIDVERKENRRRRRRRFGQKASNQNLLVHWRLSLS